MPDARSTRGSRLGRGLTGPPDSSSKVYPYPAERRRRWGSDPGAGDPAVELRLLGERAVCVGGPVGVRLFYEPGRFRRRDAIPRPLVTTLFGKGPSMSTTARPTRTARRCSCRCWTRLPPGRSPRSLTGCGRPRWTAGGMAGGWSCSTKAVRVIGVAICGWAGLPLTSHNARRRVWDLEQIWVGSLDPVDWVAPAGLSTCLRRPASGWLPGGRRPVVSPYHRLCGLT